jgi:hypothetical protein
MDFSGKKEKLEFMQSFFLRSFVISFIFLLLSTFLCMFMHDFQVMYVGRYFDLSAEDFNEIVVFLLGLWKILIIQFTLIPAIVIWGIRRCIKCN